MFVLKKIIALIVLLSLVFAGCTKPAVAPEEETLIENSNAEKTEAAVDPTEKSISESQEARDFILPDSDKRKLTEADLIGMDKDTLRLARNEIFARHGYVFKDEAIKTYFEGKGWYQENTAFDGNLSATEKSNVEFLKYNEDSVVVKVKDDVDLNGDGKKESIRFWSLHYFFALYINDQWIQQEVTDLNQDFKIVDIDPKDSYKEIIISEFGTSDDYYSYYYTYNGKEILHMGNTEGILADEYSTIEIKGNGKVKTFARSDFLHTWFYDNYYKLDQSHKLVNVPQKLYAMNYEVTMLKELPLQKSPTDKSIAVTLEPGEKVTLMNTDNEKWMSIKNHKGIEGWISIDALPGQAYEVFEGLSFAD